MSAERAFTRSWQVGKYTATLSAPRPRQGEQLAAVIEWVPNMPARLSAAELRQYRAGRNAALAQMAAELGVTVAVVEC